MIPETGNQDKPAIYTGGTNMNKGLKKELFDILAYIVEDTIKDNDIDKIINEMILPCMHRNSKAIYRFGYTPKISPDGELTFKINGEVYYEDDKGEYKPFLTPVKGKE